MAISELYTPPSSNFSEQIWVQKCLLNKISWVIDRLLPWSEELPEQCRLKKRQKKCLKQWCRYHNRKTVILHYAMFWGTYERIALYHEKIKNQRKDFQPLAWSSVRLAFRHALEIQEEIPRPKALGDIRGISYIYPIFWELSLIKVPDAVARKTKGSCWEFRCSQAAVCWYDGKLR